MEKLKELDLGPILMILFIIGLVLFITGYAIHNYYSDTNSESIENQKNENNVANRSAMSWFSIFFIGTMLLAGLSFVIYFFSHFHGM